MDIIKTIAGMKSYSSALKKAGKTVGLVPTMGALHDGHLSLLACARGFCDISIMSVFVNPVQFGPSEDFARYPRDLDRDCGLAESAGCDCLFAPSAGEMYPAGYDTGVNVGWLGGTLCGAARPGHFGGVATVVLKLFNIVAPDVAVFGAKDAQQVVVIRRVAEDLNLSVRILVAPTVREPDGMAMSSRNAYLTPAEREQAVSISRGLFMAKELFDRGERSAGRIRESVVSTIGGSGGLIQIEYVEIVNAATLRPFVVIDGAALIAVACRALESKTRLIDNIVAGE
jgi:pantoate--beta-alanine ligase